MTRRKEDVPDPIARPELNPRQQKAVDLAKQAGGEINGAIAGGMGNITRAGALKDQAQALVKGPETQEHVDKAFNAAARGAGDEEE